MSRAFDGADDEIRTAIGSSSIAAGPATIVCVIKLLDDSKWQAPIGLHNSLGVGDFLRLEVTNLGKLQYGVDGNARNSLFNVATTDGWMILAGCKASGNAQVRFHKYVFSTATWTHEGNGGNIGNGTAPGASSTVRFGEWQDDDDFDGLIAAAAIYNTQLSDGTIETFSAGVQEMLDASPVGCWKFDQASVADDVLDLTGNGANESTIVGTAVSADNPAGFDYTVGGGGVDATATPGVIAATVTMPAASKSAGVSKTPARIAASASLPAASKSGGTGASKSPATIAAVASLPPAATGVGASRSPAAIASVATLPAAAKAAGASISPARIASLASLPAASKSAGVSVSAAVLAAVAGLPAAIARAGASVAPARIISVASLPAATASGDEATDDATATPDVIVATVSLPVVSPRAGGSASPARIQALVSLPAASVSAEINGIANPGMIAAVSSLPAASLLVGATAMPGVIVVTVTLPGATFPIAVYIFRPPTSLSLPSIAVSEATGRFDTHPGYNLFKHYGPRGAVGHTVLRHGDTFTLVQTPTSRQLQEADAYYLGGRVYTVSGPEAQDLINAGFVLEPV